MNSILQKYIPHISIPVVSSWFLETKAHLTIKKPRQTKYGDFRPAYQNKPHRISVNGDLNEFHFLITLTHEFAHVYTWIEYKNTVKPHGEEWKSIYSKMLLELIELKSFPNELNKILIQHITRPKASSCSDPALFKALKSYDVNQGIILEDISIGEVFVFRNRQFIRGNKRRTRIECVDNSNGKIYLINSQANVEKV